MQEGKLSILRQCELLGLNRSSIYYKPVEESAEDLDLMLKMDKEYHQHPTKGVLGMVDFIKKFGILISPKKVRRLLRKSWFLYLTAIIDISAVILLAGIFPILLCRMHS